MVRDFTVITFRTLLKRLADAGYSFQSCREYYKSPAERVVILRHDVDKHPHNSLVTAEIEHEAGISGTYYFRSPNGRFEEETVRQISKLGHEIGYHYEDLHLASRKSKIKSRKSGINGEEELAEVAFADFRGNLAKLRRIAPVETICMHGSPLSSFDSRLLWKYYDYRDLGVEAEPYFDICFEDTLYLTDTGRRWDGASVSLRDRNRGYVYNNTDYFNGWKVKPLKGSLMNMTTRAGALQSKFTFRSTHDIISSVITGKMPRKIMMTVHPQRWNDRFLPWSRELLLQKSKNSVKYFLVRAAADH